jgi:hypothetical protein
VPYPPEPCDPKLVVEYGCAENTELIAGMAVLIGPGNEGPPLEDMVPLGLLRNLGGCVRDVKEDKLGGPIRPRLLLVRCDHGLSLIARLASLTVLCSGRISCLTSPLRSLCSLPCWVYAAASSCQAWNKTESVCFSRNITKRNGTRIYVL